CTFGQGVFCWCSNLSLIIVDGPVMTDEEIIDDFLYGVDNSVVIGYYPDYVTSWAPNGETEWYSHPLMMIENDNEPCGDSLMWSLSGGVLTINGTGEMYSFTAPTGGYPAPWADQMASITSIVIGEGVETVGTYAFYGCTGITELYLPDGLWGVMAHAFENCTNLVSVSFPASCQGVDDYGFCGCTDLSSITFREEAGGGDAPISKGLYDDSQFSYIGAYAFFGTGLTRVVLPASVSYIGYRAFGYCAGLACVTFEGYPPSVDEEVFIGTANGFHIEYTPEYAEYWAPDGETEWNGYPISEQGAVCFTVTFVDWDGTVLSTQSVPAGGSATAPENPSREGYTFMGWSCDFTNVTCDITVTATYSMNTYTVTFVDWDGTVLKTETVNYGASATAPADPVREGYTFAGWDVDFSFITGNLIVTATYTENTTPVPTATPVPTPDPTATPEPTAEPTPEPVYYTVTFVDWDGTVLSTQQVEEGASATAPADPSREGYTFIGWDTDFAAVTGDLTVTAQYSVNTYTVTFVDWDGTVLKTETVNYGGSASAPADPSREGYTFIGWDTDFANVTGDLTVTALYEQDPEPTEPPQPPAVTGDANGDGVLSSADLSVLFAYVMNAGSLTEQGLICADVNGDGQVNTLDVTLLAQLIFGA
ncbi:MAG: InlB B-repeat-containing protein, partial [Clostridia bacterium]|nr:InlB B-repeat-containing protein [Clostridia bacterium]